MGVKLFLASSNAGKLAELRELVRQCQSSLSSAPPPARVPEIQLELLPGFADKPAFPEDAPTFAENALGKALAYGQHCKDYLVADDSGLVVPVLGGAPGVLSARYAGPAATSAERNAKLLQELRTAPSNDRSAYFACAMALVRNGHPVAVVTARVDGTIPAAPRGANGFGYDPIFYFPPLAKSFAELSMAEKNEHSHRGKAFRRLLAFLASVG